jgi:hypothetical protein
MSENLGIEISNQFQNARKTACPNHTDMCVKCGNAILDDETRYISKKELKNPAVKGLYHQQCLPGSMNKYPIESEADRILNILASEEQNIDDTLKTIVEDGEFTYDGKDYQATEKVI